jgi:hypothetical protein
MYLLSCDGDEGTKFLYYELFFVLIYDCDNNNYISALI